MKILILNGSPRKNGITSTMINTFVESAKENNEITVVDVCKKNIHGCIACEYCHNKGKGTCIQKDDMNEITQLLKEANLLILASPIYYHSISGQLKCVIDRFYASLYPNKPYSLTKIAMFLASGDSNMYEAAKFSYYGDFVDYLKLESNGIYTNHDNMYLENIKEFGSNLK